MLYEVITQGWASVVWHKVHMHGKLGWWLRNAADLKAFLELETWPDAAEQWATEFDHENTCPICGK